MQAIPQGARRAARLLVLSPANRLLLLQGVDVERDHRFWVAPGGGLKPGESFESAARRELLEETGLVASIGPWIWSRRHVYTFEGQPVDQYERYFVVRVAEQSYLPTQADSYIIGHRWWSFSEIAKSDHVFAPRRLRVLLPPILDGEFPSPPLDCGI